MSFFMISNNQNKIIKSCKIWQDLGWQTNYELIGENLYIANTISKVQKKYSKALNDVYSMGTFFTKNSFDVNEIFEDLNVFDFNEEESSKLYGHYVFVIKNTHSVRVITDPIGLINIYHTADGSDFFVGNDLETIAGLSGNYELSSKEVLHFSLNESTSTKNTIFKDIFRIGVGYEVVIKNNLLSLEKLYRLELEELTFDEYTHKITEYFKALNNYQGRIGTELSAGFDTRLVASCAAGLNNVLGITNQNKFDHGVDEKIGRIIAKKLNLDFYLIPRPIQSEKSNSHLQYLLHIFSIGRNVFRSVAWKYISEEKYKVADLILGGYGGETLRAQYTGFKSIEDFVLNYYHAKDIKDIDVRRKFVSETVAVIETDLGAYLHDDIGSKLNLIYTLDKMKVWGGAAVQGMLMDGDRLHPFLDWQLMNPILSFEVNELKQAKMQVKLIEHYAPSLMEVPINPTRFSYLLKSAKVKAILKSIVNLLSVFRKKYFKSSKMKSDYADVDEFLTAQSISPALAKIVRVLVTIDDLHTLPLDVYTRVVTIEMSLIRARYIDEQIE